METFFWTEPKIVTEIEKWRTRNGRLQRLKKAAPRWFMWLALVLAFSWIVALPAFPLIMQTVSQWLIFLFVLFGPPYDISAVWKGAPRGAAHIRLTKFGVTRTAQKWEYIAWRDIENYRFELCDDAPNLRVLIVEARGRKAPLRLYYEGEQLEEQIGNAMSLGLASTRTTFPQGTIPT